MAAEATGPTPSVLQILGDFRWVRAHVSTLAVGAVLLVCLNLLIGGSSLWSLTAIGVWSMLLLVHIILLAIARLSGQLLEDDVDEEEVVLLPVKDAIFVNSPAQPESTWTPVVAPTEESASEPEVAAAPEEPSRNEEMVSWQIATDAAQGRSRSTKDNS